MSLKFRPFNFGLLGHEKLNVPKMYRSLQKSAKKVPLFKNKQMTDNISCDLKNLCNQNPDPDNDCDGSNFTIDRNDDGDHKGDRDDDRNDGCDESFTQHHDQAFVEDQWNKLSPIINESRMEIRFNDEVNSTSSSTPFPRNQISNTVKRCVKRRRRSYLSANKSRKIKLEEKISNDNALPKSGNFLIKNFDGDDSLIASLENDQTITTIQSEINDDKSLIQGNNIIRVSDSLNVTTDLNSKLLTTVDEYLIANDTGIDIPESDSHSDNTSQDANTFFGLPLQVKEILKSQRGIEYVYDWQKDCLSLPALKGHRNLIYSLPTSGGKTLVAEILIMKELLVRGKNAMLILPYVSIVQEKVRGLSPFAVDLGFHVEEYAASKGCFPPKKRRGKRSLYIATIEKADALVNSLTEGQRLDEIGIVVVDELHMVGEGGGRGARLEMCLSKIMYSSANVQIIGMSATLGNICDLQDFLKAEIYSNDFRPVQLTEYVKLGDLVYHVDHKKLKTGDEDALQPVRRVSHPATLDSKAAAFDSDHVSALAMEVIPTNSCLVFCATKKNCENVALMISKCLQPSMKDVKQTERLQLLKAIKDNVNSLCKVLQKTIPYGIAYHHSGLTMDERKLIEEAYSSNVLCLLCCTSTLAAGVNLPAKRVILRAPYIGSSFLTRSRYSQMIGRAGRAGIDSSGESIMIIQKKDRAKTLDLLKAPCDQCFSSLDYNDSKGLRALILTSIGLKICSTSDEVLSFLRHTLFYVQGMKNDDFNLKDRICKEIQRLTEMGLLQETKLTTEEASNVAVDVTVLGRAAFKGCIDVDNTKFIYSELKRGTENLVLVNELHLLYLATPLENVSDIKLNWMSYFHKMNKLSPSELQAAELIGISESFITRKAAGQRCSKGKVDEFILRRFWLTLMIFDLMKEVSVWTVAESFDTTRGFVQGLLTSASSFTSLLISFTGELQEFWSLKLLFEALLQKLSYTASLELVPLMEIPGVKQARARQLYKIGYHTLKSLAWANVEDLVQNVEHLPRRHARLIVSSAKMLLDEKAEALREEVEDMMMKP